MKLWRVIPTLLAAFTFGGCAQFDKDLDALCDVTASTLDATPDARAAQLQRDILAEFSPESKAGVAIKPALELIEPTSFYEVIREAAKEEGHTSWECAAMQQLEARARADKKADMCNGVGASMNKLAFALVPLMRAEIPAVNKDLVPPEKQLEVLQTFDREATERLRALASNSDDAYYKRKDALLGVLGCKDAPRAQTACEDLEKALPTLTNNSRVVALGAAYGVALKRSGLDPSSFQAKFQLRMQQVASQKMQGAIEGPLGDITRLTGCDFK